MIFFPILNDEQRVATRWGLSNQIAMKISLCASFCPKRKPDCSSPLRSIFEERTAVSLGSVGGGYKHFFNFFRSLPYEKVFEPQKAYLKHQTSRGIRKPRG